MHTAILSRREEINPWPALAPVGFYIVIAAGLVIGRAPPPAAWLLPVCFGAFASLILLWRSGAPVIVQSMLSMLVIVELLVIGVRSDGLGMRNVETKVSGAIESNGAPGDSPPAPSTGASHVSIASSDARREADELSRRIQQDMPNHFRDGEIQGDLKIHRRGKETRLALSWSRGPAGTAAWCGTTSVFAADAHAGIELLASEVVRKLSAPRGPCSAI